MWATATQKRNPRFRLNDGHVFSEHPVVPAQKAKCLAVTV